MLQWLQLWWVGSELGVGGELGCGIAVVVVVVGGAVVM